MSDTISAGSSATSSSGLLRVRRILASLLAVLATIYLGNEIGFRLVKFVVDCTIESVFSIPIELGLTAVGFAYIFASSEKVLKFALVLRDYVLKPDKSISLFPDCVALALIVAYLTLLSEAYSEREKCKAAAKESLPSRDVVYLIKKPSDGTSPLEWLPFFFTDLASEKKPEQGTMLSTQQEKDLARLLLSLRACVGDQQGQDVELAVRGYADTNEFSDNTAELNRQAANRRAANLHRKVRDLLGSQSGPSRVVVANSHEWPIDDPSAMTRERYFDTKPLRVTGRTKDQGLFNRRADLLIMKLGECERTRAQ
jgi:hypothetical protein